MSGEDVMDGDNIKGRWGGRDRGSADGGRGFYQVLRAGRAKEDAGSEPCLSRMLPQRNLKPVIGLDVSGVEGCLHSHMHNIKLLLALCSHRLYPRTILISLCSFSAGSHTATQFCPACSFSVVVLAASRQLIVAIWGLGTPADSFTLSAMQVPDHRCKSFSTHA